MLYKIIEAYNADQMSDHVQPLLDEGWTLYGNLTVRTYLATEYDVLFQFGSRITVYAQTLVKEESEEELDARLNYFENLLLKPIDQLTPEERKDREDFLEAEAESDSENS